LRREKTFWLKSQLFGRKKLLPSPGKDDYPSARSQLDGEEIRGAEEKIIALPPGGGPTIH
jgi:hypothetical protein